VKIDAEFAALLPPLKPEEVAELEARILAEGCREPLVVWKEEGVLIDGHNRNAICTKHGLPFQIRELSFASRGDAADWIDRNQLARRNLSPADFTLALGRCYNRTKLKQGRPPKTGQIVPLKTAEKLAIEHGVTDRTVKRAGRLADAVDKVKLAVPDVVEKYRTGEATAQAIVSAAKEPERAAKILNAKKERLEQREQLIARVATIKPSDRFVVHTADLSTWQSDHKFDYIITDPPYPKEFIPLYGTLAKRAHEWLKPNGLLIAMCGQSYFSEITRLMNEHLEYYWLACYLLPGQPTPLRQRQVNTSWKPCIVYALPGSKYDGKIFGDVWQSDGSDKAHHEWGQSISGMESIIKQVCLPGQSILDPFCGAGTTGIAALNHGCTFTGIEIDAETAKLATARLAKSVNNE